MDALEQVLAGTQTLKGAGDRFAPGLYVAWDYLDRAARESEAILDLSLDRLRGHGVSAPAEIA